MLQEKPNLTALRFRHITIRRWSERSKNPKSEPSEVFVTREEVLVRFEEIKGIVANMMALIADETFPEDLDDIEPSPTVDCHNIFHRPCFYLPQCQGVVPLTLLTRRTQMENGTTENKSSGLMARLARATSGAPPIEVPTIAVAVPPIALAPDVCVDCKGEKYTKSKDPNVPAGAFLMCKGCGGTGKTPTQGNSVPVPLTATITQGEPVPFKVEVQSEGARGVGCYPTHRRARTPPKTQSCR